MNHLGRCRIKVVAIILDRDECARLLGRRESCRREDAHSTSSLKSLDFDRIWVPWMLIFICRAFRLLIATCARQFPRIWSLSHAVRMVTWEAWSYVNFARRALVLSKIHMTSRGVWDQNNVACVCKFRFTSLTLLVREAKLMLFQSYGPSSVSWKATCLITQIEFEFETRSL